MASPKKISILWATLENQEISEELGKGLLTILAAHATIEKTTDPDFMLKRITAKDAPNVVLLPDGFVAHQENAKYWDAICKYAYERDDGSPGGTAILMGSFSTFAVWEDINRMFARAGLGWKTGNYTRTDVMLNLGAVDVLGIGTAERVVGKLPVRMSQKALFLHNVRPQWAWYLESPEWSPGAEIFRERQPDGTATSSRWYQTPVAMAQMGEQGHNGWLAYIGDVNYEKGTLDVIVAMCGCL